MVWTVKQISKTNIKNPTLIEGLPGMGNVGKIAVDFLIDALDAEKVYELTSYDLPHCVFVNEENTIELPTIDIYHKRINGKSLLLLSGDIQPISETSCYEFCDTILDTLEKGKGGEIITLGGIGLPKIPKNPRVYCTGTTKKIMRKYQSRMVSTDIYGKVGPIMGVSGLLTGLAGKRQIPAVALLAETFGHPNYLGLKGARNILRVVTDKLDMKVNLKELDQEIEELERELSDGKPKLQKFKKITKLLRKKSNSDKEGVDYIG
jgi:uncharacterized protein